MTDSAKLRRVLLIDDVVPDPALGSGYPRMTETIQAIQAMPATTLYIYPTIDVIYPANEVGAIRPWTGKDPLEILEGDLERHLLDARDHAPFAAVVISRPHNYDYAREMVRRYLPEVPVVYDAEALFYRRMERQLELVPDVERSALATAAEKMRRLERHIADDADELVFVSEEEAEILAPFARGKITVNSPLLQSMSWTITTFSERADVAFVAGWASGPKSPNIDGMQWLCREVWPRVLARLPEARLWVTGERPPVEVRRFASDTVVFTGRVEDLHAFYSGVRVIVVPNRFGAGVKNKTMEALQCGVPTVSTHVGAEGLPVHGDVGAPDGPTCPILTVTDDATTFAESVVELLRDEQHWQEDRLCLRRQCDLWAEERHGDTWQQIIDRVAPLSGRGREPADLFDAAIGRESRRRR